VANLLRKINGQPDNRQRANGLTSLDVPTRLLNTPLMVSQSETDLILASLSGSLTAGMFPGFFEEERSRTYEVKNGVAVLPVMGG
jgi:hypothetical protein